MRNMLVAGLCALFGLGAVVACGDDDNQAGSGTSSGTSSGQASSSGGASSGAGGPVANTEDRCAIFCRPDGVDACLPSFLSKITGQGNDESTQCSELCRLIAPVRASDPGAATADACAVEMGKYLDCAYPCITEDDLANARCFGYSCENEDKPQGPAEFGVKQIGLGKCERTAVEAACKDKLATFTPTEGPKTAAGQCSKVCTKKAGKPCDSTNCSLGCSFYQSSSEACQAAELALADCELAAADVCNASCKSEGDAWFEACPKQ